MVHRAGARAEVEHGGQRAGEIVLCADYLGVGAVFPTGTKTDANAVSYDTLRDICAAVSIPVIAIGGITKDNVARLSGSGIVGVAVVSAIFAQPDIPAATRELKAAVRTALDL